MTDSELSLLWSALRFASVKHRDCRRKGLESSPYVNHLIEVVDLLIHVGEITDVETLAAAVLHDTIEDTETTAEELDALFGPVITGLVVEVTDDKTLLKPERKRLQVEHAPHLTVRAQRVKLADKVSNVRSVTDEPPSHWDLERRLAYFDWAERVDAGLRDCNAPLERLFDETLARGRSSLGSPKVGYEYSETSAGS